MPTWSPAQYLRFENERTRPALDLLVRVPLDSPAVVYDLGCGPGTLTVLLKARWPNARIVGLDSSPAMLEKARSLDSEIEWREADLDGFSPDESCDLLFSNAALHWVDHHETLFPRLAGFLAPGGVLAVQMPFNFAAPSHTGIVESVRSGPWRERIEPHLPAWPVLEPIRYYEILRAEARSMDIWETTYLHVLEGEDPVVEWFKGSALRPVLDRLSDAEAKLFLEEYRRRTRAAYPREKDGKTLLPFRRLFLVATR
jgi:trans-aconitate 2-methyltransferase